MASVKKIVKSFLKRPQPAYYKFQDVIKVLEYFEYTKESQKGSHFIYHKDNNLITIVLHKSEVKRWYVKEVVKVLNLEDWYENQ